MAELSVATEAFTGTFNFETREIAGTTYTNDPLSGTWAEDTGGESFADASFVDAVSGRLSLDNVTARVRKPSMALPCCASMEL